MFPAVQARTHKCRVLTCELFFEQETGPPPLKDELIVDRNASIQVRPSLEALKREAADLESQIRQLQVRINNWWCVPFRYKTANCLCMRRSRGAVDERSIGPVTLHTCGVWKIWPNGVAYLFPHICFDTNLLFGVWVICCFASFRSILIELLRCGSVYPFLFFHLGFYRCPRS